MNVLDFWKKKNRREKISMISCYDFSQAKMVEKSNVDAILVGDSVAMVVHGFSSTVHADIKMMEMHTAAVRRGTSKFIVGDLPFMSYRKGELYAMESVEILMKAGANAIKLEGLEGNEKIIKNIILSGVPVMGHLGFTPQSLNQLGGFKVQGKNENEIIKIVEEARRLEDLGVFSIVLECVPTEVAEMVTNSVGVATIGIGAGVDTDGQILVFNDLLGMDEAFKPKFLRKYLNSEELITESLNHFHADVLKKEFPNLNESYFLTQKEEKNVKIYSV